MVARLVAALVMVAGLAAAQAASPRLAQSAPDAAARAQKLDALFARLKTVTAEDEGDATVAEIWKLWQQSGTPELDALMEQASSMIGAGLHPLALPILDDLIKRAPDWAEAWNKRATARYLMGEYDGSLADIGRVLALEPRHFGAMGGIGLNRIAKGEFREALAAYRRALAVNPFLKERLELMPALEKKLGEKPI
jgi:tetratricopeptide (TPR) repeat protein